MTDRRWIEVTGAARRELKRIKDKTLLKRLVSAIDGLAASPFSPGAQKLTNVPHLWRIRVGGYRTIYAVGDDVVIIICGLQHRKDANRIIDGEGARLASILPS